MAAAPISRRLLLLAGAAASAGLLAGCRPEATASAAAHSPATATPLAVTTSSPSPTPTPVFTRPPVPRVPVPHGTITALPTTGPYFSWTCDDGIDADVITAYTDLAQATGARFTFFLNGFRQSVVDTVPIVRPLVEAGVIQIGNHTWSHPDLTKLSDTQISAELEQNHEFIEKNYGVDDRPFYRPPYGFHDARVDAVAASLGYTVPTLWYGSLADSSLIPAGEIVALAQKWFLPEHIVIAHLNHPPVISVLQQLWGIVQQRGLTTVTLNDVFSSSYHP